MKISIRRLLPLFLAALLTSFFCLALYFFNNKYTRQTVQPANGLMVVSEQDLDELLYLIDGWAFYPDVLLTPDDFASGSPKRYMVYTNIGDHTRFDTPGEPDTPYGCGTYVLHLVLPEKTAVYGLELPEIFSAYRLFINGKNVLSVGDPDPDTYKARTQTRMATFEASGRADLLLQVSDYTHYYSGIVYAPALGKPLLINETRAMRLTIILICDTIGLMLMLFSFYAAIRMKQRHALLFSLLCFSMCVFTSYGFIHVLFELPVFPLYTLELFSGYLLIFLTILLQNYLCKTDWLASRISSAAALVFCLLSLLYGITSAASRITNWERDAFSILVVAYKAAVAAYLLITSFLAFRAGTVRSRALLLANVVYGATFVWDRLLSSYEPVLGGWFTEWGSFVLVLATGYTIWRDIITAYSYSLAFAEEHHQMTRQLAMQTAYAKQIAEQNESRRKLTHDFRQHIHTLMTMATQLQQMPHLDESDALLAELINYLSHIETSPIRLRTQGSFCSNVAVDALLQYYANAAKESHIQTSFQLLLPARLPLTDVELCTMLGNLLENALDACRRMTPATDASPRTIRLFTKETGMLFFLCVENSYDGIVLSDKGHFLSRKRNGQRSGIGISSIREIAERHGGSVSVYPMEHLFRVGITLPMK